MLRNLGKVKKSIVSLLLLNKNLSLSLVFISLCFQQETRNLFNKK